MRTDSRALVAAIIGFAFLAFAFVFVRGRESSATAPASDVAALPAPCTAAAISPASAVSSRGSIDVEPRTRAPRFDTSPATIAGRVIDETGVPIGQASIRLRVGSLDDSAEVLLRGIDLLSPLAVAETDGDGAFRLGEVPGVGGLAIEVRREGFADAIRRDLAFLPGRAHDLSPFVLAAEARLAGRAVDETGAPIAGATVTVTVDDGVEDRFNVRDLENRHARETRTDDDGRFRVLGIPEVTVSVGVREGARRAMLRNVALTAGSEADLRSLVLTTPDQVRGFIRDSRGRPLANAEVVALGEARSTTKSGADGAFTLSDVGAEDPLRIGVGRVGYRARLFEHPRDGQPALVSLEAFPRIELDVRDAESCGPVEPREIRVETGDGLSEALASLPEESRGLGHVVLSVERLDVVRLRVLAPGYAPSDAIEVDPSRSAPGSPIAVALRKAFTIRGRLVVEG
ncbi:MAG TPA: carboxypeptidase-like regulatory domain-containing protein, partial [Planctomycetota bacterium]|nr:carboxypeptidase-like regulatory domain-containing protein [Planctomycetota bacterium]